jgi:small-conductance mechanosensitive channel
MNELLDGLNYEELLGRVYYGNTVLDYLIVLGSSLLGIFLIMFFKNHILKKVKTWTGKSTTKIDNFVVTSVERFGIPALYIGVAYVGLNYLTISEGASRIFRFIITLLLTFLVLRILSSVILMVLQSYVSKKERGAERVKELGGLMLVINFVIWALGLLFLFDNMGFNVTAALAGLGIGGVAIALASQNILGDLFNYFVIFFDKPFETGDFIIVDDKMGVVDYIGVKSTQVKSLSGEQLIFSNSDLTTSRIHNYKRMQRRRIVFKLGLVYETSFEQLKQVPELLKEIIKRQHMVEFDRAHFASYGAYSLDFEIVYYVLSSDYNSYMDVQQRINFTIFEEFQQRGLEFAFPTQSLFLKGQNQEVFRENEYREEREHVNS